MVFKHRDVVEIVINRMVSTKVASGGHVVEQSVADPMESDKCVTYSLKLRCDDINNRDCLTVIHGRAMANDKYRWLIKKWASLAKAHGDAKRADAHKNETFYIGKSLKIWLIKTSNAQQLQKIRNIMTETTMADAVSKDLNGLVECFKDTTLLRHIDSRCSQVFPLENVSVGKV